MAIRQVFEKPIVDEFETEARKVCPDASMFRGLVKRNRIGPKKWALTGFQEFQFGDFRVELDDRYVVMEIENAGSVGNLVKFWTLLDGLPKHLFLIHVFRVGSKGDYISHRLLWKFLYEKMKQDPICSKFNAWQFNRGTDSEASFAEALERFRRCLKEPITSL